MVVDDKHLHRVEFYIDPEKRLYDALGFNWRSTPANWKSFIVKMYAKTHLSEAGSEIKGERLPPGMQYNFNDFMFRKFVKNDDPFQQGGDAVLDANMKLLKIFSMKSVNDRPSADQVLSV